MKSAASFIVKYRYLVLGVMLIICVICGIFMTRVSINADMTKYLPDDSNMKQGMDLMEQEFPDSKTSNTIRVMFSNLTQEEISDIEEQLTQIQYVDSVDYKAGSEEYNQGSYTLFIIHTSYDYGSEEESSIEEMILQQYAGYDLAVKNDSTSNGNLPAWIILLALVAGMIILCAMCNSWAEPFLFLVTLGVAVVINMGTNIFLGSISVTTFSIAAILQLVLSMDYSIILMNRYRQERQLTDDRLTAMTFALRNAFSSIASSGMTTVVGLLMLVFMSFKIGFDLGVVLAKGVLLGMICVLTILPCLILRFEWLIEKTAKKQLRIPMTGLAGFSYRFRRPLTVLFVALFIGGYVMQSMTNTAYSLHMEDPIAEIFPVSNSLALLYDNRDEEQVAAIAEKLEDVDGIDSVLCYSTTLGKEYTVQEMSNTMDAIGTDTSLDSSLLRLLYYNYFNGKLPMLTASEFLRFVSDTSENNDMLSSHLGGEMTDYIPIMAQFAEPQALTTPHSANDLASLFNMDTAQVQQLYLYYFMQNGGVDSGTMCVSTFADFILNEVATDPFYSTMFHEATPAHLEDLATFTDINTVTQPTTYTQLANLLGMDASQMHLLFVYYQAMNHSYQPGSMTLPTFTNFLQNNIRNNTAFSSNFDAQTLAQIDLLAQFTDTNTLQTAMDSMQLAQLLDIDAAMVDQVMCLYFGADTAATATMTLPEFMDFLNGTVMTDPRYAAYFDADTQANLTSLQQTLTAAASGQQFSYHQLASLLGLDESLVQQLFYLYYSAMDISGYCMTVNGFLGYLLSDAAQNPALAGSIGDTAISQLSSLYQLTSLAASGQALDILTLSTITGIDTETVETIFAYQSTATGQNITSMSLPAFMTLVTSDSFSTYFDAATLTQLHTINTLVQAAASEQAYSAGQLAVMIGIPEATVQQIFVLYYSSQQTMTLVEFTTFLTGSVMADPTYSTYFDPATQAQLMDLHQMIHAAATGQSFTAAQMTQMMGFDASLVQLIYSWYCGNQISGKAVTPVQFVNFLLSDTSFAAFLDHASLQQLTYLQQLMQAALSNNLYSVSQMSALLELEESTVRLLYTYYASLYSIGGWQISLQTLVNFLVSNSQVASMLPADALQQLSLVQSLINATVNGTLYTAPTLANLLGIDANQMRALFLLYTSRHGDTSNWRLSIETFVNFMVSDVLQNDTFADSFDSHTASELTGLQMLIRAVLTGKSYSAAQMTEILENLTDSLDESTTELLYLYYASVNLSDPAWTMSITQLFRHLSNEILNDQRFAPAIDDNMCQQIYDIQAQLEDSIAQLQGTHYSILMLDTSLPVEADETTAFITDLLEQCEKNLQGKYYLIGNSAMNYEMEESFDHEMLLITLLTALAIFLVVAVTFRSIFIPLLLVLLVQCGVFLTVSFSGVRGYSIYYLAMLIVQCILMGATIDYGILFTNYYREHRQTEGIKQALISAYAGSTHTILTSGLVIILVTAVIAISPADETIAQICQTISIGALFACVLILFILPGLLATLDRVVINRKKQKNTAPNK